MRTNVIGTNVMLKEMGVTNNNKCNFCLTAKDTIQLFFLVGGVGGGGSVNTANSSGHGFWSY